MAEESPASGSPAALVATLLVEGRQCDVNPVRGSAVGAASGVAAHLGPGAEHVGGSWMPGRIAIVHAGDLTDDEVRRLLAPEQAPPFAAVVLLADDAVDTGRFQRVAATVPVVLSRRIADHPRLTLAKHVELSVATSAATGRPPSGIWGFQVRPRRPSSGPPRAAAAHGTVPAPREARTRASH